MKATYVSVWDGGYKIETSCEYDPATKKVTDIETEDVDDLDLDILTDEYIEFGDEEIRDFINPDKEEE